MNENPAALNRVCDDLERVEALSEQNVYACYQCGKCTADCPFSFSPNLVMRLTQLGQIEEARHLVTTWECASCYACGTGCPKGVNPAKVIKALRSLDGGRPLDTLALALSEPATEAGPARPPSRGRSRPVLYSIGAMRAIRARLIAAMPATFRVASSLAPLSNWLMKFPGLRLLGHLLLGVHRERPIPRFASQSFPAWFRNRQPLGDGRRGPVALFHDTFNDFNYPQTEIAAVELLEKAGFRVELTDNVCCGRPAISEDLAPTAARAARVNIRRLYEQAVKGMYIVGCEPSCLLTLRDEYPHLAPEELREKARVVAEKALLLDEFLTMLKEKGELELTFKRAADQPPIIFHGHCHQKAGADATKSLDILNVAGYDSVQFANAACCGMAGAYGYEKEHYRPSEQAGERGLFPLVRGLPDAQVVVMGVSCRQQIEHFTGRPVRHLAEVLREALEG